MDLISVPFTCDDAFWNCGENKKTITYSQCVLDLSRMTLKTKASKVSRSCDDGVSDTEIVTDIQDVPTKYARIDLRMDEQLFYLRDEKSGRFVGYIEMIMRASIDGYHAIFLLTKFKD